MLKISLTSEEATAVMNLLEREMIESHLRENQIKRTLYIASLKWILSDKQRAEIDFEHRQRELFGGLIAEFRSAELRDAEGGGEDGS